MDEEKKVRVVLCDDHLIIIEGLQRLLADAPGVECVGAATSGQELLETLQHLAADIVLLDLDMPAMGGAEVLPKIKERWPEIRVVILTMHDEAAVIRNLMEQGADGYLLKTCGRDELLRAVQAVQEGNKHFSAAITEGLLQRRKESIHHGDARLRLLSVRECEVLSALAEGLSNKEIGNRLFISARTVDTHRSNIMKKLGAHNVAALVRIAVASGLVK